MQDDALVRVAVLPFFVSGSSVINGGNTLQLKDIGYEKMAGTYICTVTGIGGESSASSTLEVYCKY